MNNMMKITIDESGYPGNVLINDVSYSLFCEYTNMAGNNVKIYSNDYTDGVVVDFGNQNAYVGMFSTLPGQIDKLFDYIEATISLKDGFDVYSEDFTRCLNLVDDKKHQLIRDVFDNKDSFLTNMLNRIRKEVAKSKISGDADFLNKNNRCLIEYVGKGVVQEDVPVYGQSPVENPDPVEKKITPVKSLPEGWRWIDYADGSGSLETPEGKSSFGYDLCTSYTQLGGIEYKRTDDAKWDVFWGTLEEFKANAESVIDKELYCLGSFNVTHIMRELSNNAWSGLKPTQICIAAGENLIEIKGYIYEPGYEMFSATASLSINGQILYGKDSRNVEAYRNEVYQTGVYDKLEDAVSYIKEQTKGKEFVLVEEKKPLDSVIKSAEQEATFNSSEGEHKDGVDFEL